ncbi:MAG: DUF3775 domain-containing protein [Pseudomonadota bacterium]
MVIVARTTANLMIDPATVRIFINKAKAIAAGVGQRDADHADDAVEFDVDRLEDSHHHDGLAEEETQDLTATELTELIDDLNDDEAASLVAITWVGRGDYDATAFNEAVSDAKERAHSATSGYLLGMPLLSEYLEAGLDALGR